MIYVNCPKKELKGKICMKAKSDFPNRVHSDQIVLETGRREGLSAVRRWPNDTLKKLS
jgi:hypothetical protein